MANGSKTQVRFLSFLFKINQQVYISLGKTEMIDILHVQYVLTE